MKETMDPRKVGKRFRIKKGVKIYPGKVLEARFVTDTGALGHIRISRSKYAEGIRQYRLDELGELK